MFVLFLPFGREFMPSVITSFPFPLSLDSSIFPVQISAHLSATVYGIAEKVCPTSTASYRSPELIVTTYRLQI